MSNLAPAINSAVKIIELLASEKDVIGISEIARRCDINKNMVFRIMNSLEEEGWVYSDENAKYRLSLRPFQITSRVLHQISLNNLAVPFVRELWKKTGESTYFGILKNDEVLYISHFDSVQNLRVAGTLGGTYPIYCTGPGKAALAFMDDEYIERYLANAPFPKHTEHTLSTKEEILAELELIRQRGYSLDNEEYSPGILCVCAPVFDADGCVVGAVGCSASTVYCKNDDIYKLHGEAVIETARKISQSMGYTYRT
ncbi:MAG: IclR family transcriptional regulator [Clostridia bacterium]|nr:IclR family transcriptional regulator [Clostridia bacterium]